MSNRARMQPARQQTTQASIRALEKRLTGHKTTPSINPTSFVQLPWNSWTFERTDVTAAAFETVEITVNDILSQIRARIGLLADGDLRVKVQSAQVWNTSTTPLLLPDTSVLFYEIATPATVAEQYPRSTQRDIGTLNMPARIGYTYPSADKREILGATQSAYKVVSAEAVTAGSNVTVRIQVLWQATPAA